MADEPSSVSPPDEQWGQREERFWKSEGRRNAMLKNLIWLAAGVGLAILLNQLGCSGFTFG
jgi:hypothetical protein